MSDATVEGPKHAPHPRPLPDQGKSAWRTDMTRARLNHPRHRAETGGDRITAQELAILAPLLRRAPRPVPAWLRPDRG